jgi:hypothetical protein
MADLTLRSPSQQTFDNVSQVKALMMGGSIRLVGSSDRVAKLDVSEIDRSPLIVRQHDNGLLELTHGPLSAGRILTGRLTRHRKHQAVISLTVPEDCELDISGAMEGVSVSGFSGSVRLFTSHCDQALAHLSGPVDVTNFSGDVQAVAISGSLNVQTSDANIAIAGATGSVRARSGSGTITIDARPKVGTDLQLHTMNGPVYAGLPKLSDIKLHLETSSGQIYSQFDEVKPVTEDQVTIVSDSYGTPNSRLWVKTVSGDIALVQRDVADEEVG